MRRLFPFACAVALWACGEARDPASTPPAAATAPAANGPATAAAALPTRTDTEAAADPEEAPPGAVPAHAPVPADPAPVMARLPSIYDLDLALESHDEKAIKLDAHAGHPVIISMFYASCPAVCPTLIRDIRRIDDALTPETRAETRVLLVTFDPVADTPAKLRQLAENHKVDTTRWTLARAADDEATRELATALGIRYRAVEDGHFNHTTIITLLDTLGRPLGRIDGLNQDSTAFLATLAATRTPTAAGAEAR